MPRGRYPCGWLRLCVHALHGETTWRGLGRRPRIALVSWTFAKLPYRSTGIIGRGTHHHARDDCGRRAESGGKLSRGPTLRFDTAPSDDTSRVTPSGAWERERRPPRSGSPRGVVLLTNSAGLLTLSIAGTRDRQRRRKQSMSRFRAGRWPRQGAPASAALSGENRRPRSRPDFVPAARRLQTRAGIATGRSSGDRRLQTPSRPVPVFFDGGCTRRGKIEGGPHFTFKN
jgi:hypothetical protein